MAADLLVPLSPLLVPAVFGDVWTDFAAVVAALLLPVILWRVARHVPPSPPEPTPGPMSPPADVLPSALAPAGPQIMQEVGGEDGEPVRAIPADSTEWMEGEALEGDGPRVHGLRPIAALMEALHSGEALVCADAVEELVHHGAAAVPALEQALQDDDQDVRVDAAKALAAIRENEA